MLENGIKEVRIQVMTGYKLYLNEKERIGQFFDTGIEHTRCNLKIVTIYIYIHIYIVN